MSEPVPIYMTLEEFAAEDLRDAMRSDIEEVRDIETRFRIFHRANPGVYAALVRLARRAKAAGHEHLGISMIWEVLRWEELVGDTKLGDGYKLSNSFRSRYSRLIMEQEPDLEGFFTTRRLRSP